MNNLMHLKCIFHGLAIIASEKVTFVSQNIDLGLVFDLADDVALLLIAAFF